ncbi:MULTISPECIES: HD-GYP domain-containing protein [Eisenbergiella]|uniref:HD-GYP domain-containing protein n=1 Tax=Eisenbergiella TaxID=1432051 RepID=UPI002A91CC81|nr:HD domain-containing phosphohydrolase [Eisenbergiella porci]MDY5526272.1 HD domain-containing phosphohydrolase [Eisenbergiella porci]
MRTHVELTGLILGPDVEEKIRKIAMRHHEKLDDSGYPLGLTAMVLSLEERIVAVADIVSALAGTRSYKEAFSRERIVGIIGKMKEDGLIDGSIVDVMTDNFDDIMGKQECVASRLWICIRISRGNIRNLPAIWRETGMADIIIGQQLLTMLDVTVEAGLCIYCADREKAWRRQASAPRRRRLFMGGSSNSSAEGRTVTA